MNILQHPIIRGILHRIKCYRDKRRKYQQAGLSFLKKIYLKHAQNQTSLKKHTSSLGVVYYRHAQQLYHGLQEVMVEEVYLQALRTHATILDLGAHIGLSVLYFKKLAPSASIIAFEPDRTNFALLEKNVAANHLQNVTILPMAVWINDGTSNFVPQAGMDSHLATNTDHSQYTTQVQTTSVLPYLNKPIDFVKIDIEGAEYEVLKQIAPKLSLVRRIFIEYHGSYEQQTHLIEILDLLDKAGFDFYIKEASHVYTHPFLRFPKTKHPFDVQINLFGTRRSEQNLE